MLYQLAYVSRAVGTWTRPDLIALLRQARVRNEARGITGVLLFRNGSFLQLLEGERDEVEALFDLILLDPRHEGTALIWDAEASHRWFADWSMGFRDLEQDPVTEPGLTDILRGPVEASMFSHEVITQLWTRLLPVIPPAVTETV